MSTDDPSFWVKTNWPTADLQNKLVEFEVDSLKFGAFGIGRFLVSERPSGEQYIEIVVTEPDPYPITKQSRFILRQHHADRIERHFDQSVAEFQVLS